MNIHNVLFITRNLPPLIGGMETLNFRIFSILNNHYRVDVMGPKGVGSYVGKSVVVESPIKPLWLYFLSVLVSAVVCSFRKKYDVIICGSGLVSPMGWIASRIAKAKFVVYLHGLDVVADSLIYQTLFIPLLRRADIFFVNSNYTKELALNLRFPSEKIHVLYPGVELINLDDSSVLKHSFLQERQLTNKKVLLIAGRITERKGIVEFIENCMPDILAAHPDVHLLIVGGEATNALKSYEGVTQKIKSAISKLKLEQSVTLAGSVSNEELHAAYCSAELFVFPVLDLPNDIEGFGMVAVEAAARGLPTVAFGVGGIPDAVEHGVSGILVNSGNYTEMKNSILSLLNSNNRFVNECVNHSKKYSWNSFETSLLKIINSFL